VGALGFLALVAWLLFWKAGKGPRGDTERLLDHLSVHNASCLLLGTIGGFGSLFAYLISPQIRGYNRISTFLLFMALCPVAIVLERLVRRARGSVLASAVVRLLLVIVVTLGLLDQVPKGLPSLEEFKQVYYGEREFFSRVQAAAPPRAMVFVMPTDRFPEGKSYEPLKPYLHVTGLRWSCGAVYHRQAQRWQERVLALPQARMIETLVTAGFSGMVLDRGRFEDGGENLRVALSEAGVSDPIQSHDMRWWYFDLRDVERRLRTGVSDAEWAERRERALYPPTLEWAAGFSEERTVPGHMVRWCGAAGKLRIVGAAPETRSVRVEMLLASLGGGEVRIAGPGFEDRMPLPAGGESRRYARTFDLPPGPQTLTFECDAPLTLPPDSDQPAAFCIADCTVLGVSRGRLGY
jgi:phosphoglycerol transferase